MDGIASCGVQAISLPVQRRQEAEGESCTKPVEGVEALRDEVAFCTPLDEHSERRCAAPQDAFRNKGGSAWGFELSRCIGECCQPPMEVRGTPSIQDLHPTVSGVG